jgi:hypothetical protein
MLIVFAVARQGLCMVHAWYKELLAAHQVTDDSILFFPVHERSFAYGNK